MPTLAETSLPVTLSLLLPADQLERGVEAGGVAEGEQHLGVGGAAGAAQLLGHPQVEVEDAVVAAGVAVAAVPGGEGGRGVQNVHRVPPRSM